MGKDYKEIMNEITSNLTGDPTRDIEYLTEKAEEYKAHEMATEILRGIGRIMYEILPADKKEAFENAMKKDAISWQATLEEIDFCIYKRDFNKARILTELLIEKLEGVGMYKEDEVSIYKDFKETFEEILFRFREEPEKNLRAVNIPYADIYLRYGSLLFEFHEHEKAKEALRKAAVWNPVSTGIAFELAENYKATGDLETFFELSKENHKSCFRPEALARCYRNFAFYFSETGRYREATACIHMSAVYDDTSANIQSELYYIQEMNGDVRIDLKPAEARELLEEAGIPTGPDQDILGLSFTLAKECLDSKNLEGAEYFLKIFYDLTDDEQTGKMLESVRKTLSGGRGN